MSYLEVFGVLTGVGVNVSKICGVGAGAESEKCDSTHLWYIWVLFFMHNPLMVNHTFNAMPTEMLQQYILVKFNTFNAVWEPYVSLF